MQRCNRIRATWLFLLLFLAIPAFAISDIAVSRAWDGGAIANGGSFTFPDPVTVGLTDSRQFRISNTGNTSLTLNSTALVSGSCFHQIENPVTPIAPGGSTTFRVRLQCSTAGTKTGTITIGSNDPDENPYTISLSGTVTPAPAPDISLFRDWDNGAVARNSTVSFPNPIPAYVSDSLRFRITNNGNASLDLTNAASLVSGTGFHQLETPATPIPAGGSGWVRVRLLSGTPGTYTGTVSIASNDPDESPYTFYVTGTVTPPPPPDISVFRDWDSGAVARNATVSFPNPTPAYVSDSLRFRITNNGSGSLDLTNAASLVSGTGFHQLETPATPIPAGGSSWVRVRLLSGTPGTYTGTVSIASNDPDESPYTFYVTGTVTPPPPPDISVFRDWDSGAVAQNSTVTFANPVPANTSDSLRFRITNNGTGNLDLTNATTLVSGTCFHQIETPTTPVPPGASAWVRVRILCGTPGSYTGTVTIQSNDPDENPYRFYVAGTVTAPVAPEIAVTRAWDNVAVASGGSFAFPDPVRAGVADSRLFYINNSGNTPLNIANASTLVSGAGFHLVEQPVTPVPAGGRSQFRVRLMHATPGTYTGSVSIQSDDADESPYTIALSGSVVANGAAYVSHVFPTSMNANQFYDVSVTMRNTGGTTWTNAKLYRLGVRPDTAASQWRFNGRVDLAANESVAPNATRTFSFRLQAPSTPGTYTVQWQMVEELVEWFGTLSPVITVNVGASRNDAAFVSQSVPSTMNAAQKYNVSVTMKNTGGTTWSETTRHRLGNQIAGDPFTHRRLLPSGVTVAPGQQYTFSWQVTAPASPGTYTFQWRMVEELVEWFGPFTPSIPVTVRVATPPVVNTITPDTVKTGTITNVTVTGHRLGGSTVKFGALDGVPSPAASLVSISPDGTTMTVRVDATNAAVDGFHPLIVQSSDGKGAGEIRVVPNRPVVDIYTPSQASWGDLYFFNVAGANLANVQVVPMSSAVEFIDLESDDGMISGILEVEPGSGTVSTTIELRGAGGVASIPIELRDRAALTQKTSLAGRSSSAEATAIPGAVSGILIQDPVQTLKSATAKSLDWQISCRFGRSRGRYRTGTRVLLKQLNDPIVQNVLQSFWKGETRRIQTLVTFWGFAVQVSIEITCYLDSGGGEHFGINFCFYFESYIETVGLGGQRVVIEACAGTNTHVTISGSGFYNFHYNWGPGGSQPNGNCVGTVDRSPRPFDGPRITDVTMNNCCEESATLQMDFILGEDASGSSRNFSREVGPFTPHLNYCPVFQVTITEPPDNPRPPDLAHNFTFLAEREHAQVETGTTITAKATLNPTGDPTRINWTITPSVGSIRAVTPDTKKGPQVSFMPDAPDHPPYVQGNGCGSPGNGSCDRSEPLKYEIKAEYDGYADINTIVQDEIDIIRQEYRNHGITVPRRSDFNAVTPTATYSAAQINITPYRLILGTPGIVAQNVYDLFNSRIHDDAQLVLVGTADVAANVPIVGPGANIQVVGAILTTRPCFPSPPTACDDVRSGDFIFAGPDGVAETRARVQRTSVFININSAWRNPERNEAVHGVKESHHQYGGATDLAILGPAEGLTTSELWCLLQTAADDAGYNGFAEFGPSPAPSCTSSVSHVHVQPR